MKKLLLLAVLLLTISMTAQTFSLEKIEIGENQFTPQRGTIIVSEDIINIEFNASKSGKHFQYALTVLETRKIGLQMYQYHIAPQGGIEYVIGIAQENDVYFMIVMLYDTINEKTLTITYTLRLII